MPNCVSVHTCILIACTYEHIGASSVDDFTLLFFILFNEGQRMKRDAAQRSTTEQFLVLLLYPVTAKNKEKKKPRNVIFFPYNVFCVCCP